MTNRESPEPEEFEKRNEALENLVSFAEGDFFPPDQKTIKRIVSAQNTHLIYLDSEDRIQWSLKDAEISDAYAEVCTGIAILQAHSEALLKRRQRRNFNFSMATALSATLNGNDGEARKQLDRLNEQLKDKVRLLYLSGSCVCFVLVLIFAIVFWWQRVILEPGLTPIVFEFILATCAGAGGAFVSVLLKRNHILISPDRMPYLMDGASRILLGMISAFFAAFAIKLELIAGVVADNRLGVIAISGLAGTLEYFVPHVVKTIGIGSRTAQEHEPE